MATKLARATEVANAWKAEAKAHRQENLSLRHLCKTGHEMMEVVNHLGLLDETSPPDELKRADVTKIIGALKDFKTALDATVFAVLPGEDPYSAGPLDKDE